MIRLLNPWVTMIPVQRSVVFRAALKYRPGIDHNQGHRGSMEPNLMSPVIPM